MRVLVTGRGGQLASEFEQICNYDNNWEFCSVSDLDITNKIDVQNKINNGNFKYVINCAAYTAVDEAEINIELAKKVNYLGVKNLLEVCEEHNVKLVHFSTDYVFDGKSSVAYKENDKTSPLSIYGKSKLLGENVILTSNVKSIIIRTSWVYSNYGKNFVKTMISLSKNNDVINVISDQVGSPTNANDLAKSVIKIINHKNYIWKSGDIFNFSNLGECSWYDFAKEIFTILKIDVKIKKVASSEFKTIVDRPNYSLLDKSKIISVFDLEIMDWKKSLKKMLTKYNKMI